jgi:hypothetical protein
MKILMLFIIMLLSVALTIITIKPLVRKKRIYRCCFCSNNYDENNDENNDDYEENSNATTEN